MNNGNGDRNGRFSPIAPTPLFPKTGNTELCGVFGGEAVASAETQQTHHLAAAAQALLSDYESNRELTTFTAMDEECFDL